MVKEYHEDSIHIIIDCKTGNKNLDQSIENSILGYVYMVIYCLETGRLHQLIGKTKDMAIEFKNKGLKNNNNNK